MVPERKDDAQNRGRHKKVHRNVIECLLQKGRGAKKVEDEISRYTEDESTVEGIYIYIYVYIYIYLCVRACVCVYVFGMHDCGTQKPRFVISNG